MMLRLSWNVLDLIFCQGELFVCLLPHCIHAACNVVLNDLIGITKTKFYTAKLITYVSALAFWDFVWRRIVIVPIIEPSFVHLLKIWENAKIKCFNNNVIHCIERQDNL